MACYASLYWSSGCSAVLHLRDYLADGKHFNKQHRNISFWFLKMCWSENILNERTASNEDFFTKKALQDTLMKILNLPYPPLLHKQKPQVFYAEKLSCFLYLQRRFLEGISEVSVLKTSDKWGSLVVLTGIDSVCKFHRYWISGSKL